MSDPLAIEFGAGVLRGRVFVGQVAGEEARRAFMLSEEDALPETIRVVIPEDVFSITSSFFLAMFGDSIRAAGSRDAFRKRFWFRCPDRIMLDTIEPSIERALFESWVEMTVRTNEYVLVPGPSTRGPSFATIEEAQRAGIRVFGETGRFAVARVIPFPAADDAAGCVQ